jgi:hypothetical protein
MDLVSCPSHILVVLAEEEAERQEVGALKIRVIALSPYSQIR